MFQRATIKGTHKGLGLGFRGLGFRDLCLKDFVGCFKGLLLRELIRGARV